MSETPNSNALRNASRRWRLAAPLLLAALALLLGASSSALAATPTAPPPVSILTPYSHPGQYDIFISPFGGTDTYANGPEILDQKGNVVWFKAVPAGQEAADFRSQTYRGQQVLTWGRAPVSVELATGTDYIYNNHYQQIAAVNAGNGLSADGHEFLITPQNTALILSYTTATADLSSIGGPSNQTVIDGVVQEIDIPTGKVLFQWNSQDHVPYSQSEQPLPASASSPWDWFHINAVHLDTDGNLLIDARDTWTTYKVNLHSGAIIWQLGGKASDFTFQTASGQTLNKAGEIFAWQHDPEALGNDEYTVFDNEAAGVGNTGIDPTAEFGLSRVVRFKLDEHAHTATLEQSFDQPESLTAPSQGNGEPIPGGGQFVGWGSLPYFSQFDAAGNLVFNAQFPTGVNSYRAYELPWSPAGSGSGSGGGSGHGGHGHYPGGSYGHGPGQPPVHRYPHRRVARH